VEDIPLPIALTETPAPEVLPTAETVVIEHVTTAEPVSIETPHSKVAKSEVNITNSTSADKNCSVLNLAHVFLYLLLNPKNFAEVLVEVAPPVMSEPEQEEEATPPVIDPVMLGVIHQRVIQQ